MSQMRTLLTPGDLKVAGELVEEFNHLTTLLQTEEFAVICKRFDYNIRNEAHRRIIGAIEEVHTDHWMFSGIHNMIDSRIKHIRSVLLNQYNVEV